MSAKRLEISPPRPSDSVSPMQEQQQQQQQQNQQHQLVAGDRIPAPPSSALAADEMQSLLSHVLVDLVEARRRTELRRTVRRKDQEASDVKHTRMAKALGKIPCIGATLKAKYLNSKLVSYLEGVGVRSEDVDGLVNSVTLVNALILTIPPGIVTSLGMNSGTWDTLETVISLCNIEGSELFWYEPSLFQTCTIYLSDAASSRKPGLADITSSSLPSCRGRIFAPLAASHNSLFVPPSSLPHPHSPHT